MKRLLPPWQIRHGYPCDENRLISVLFRREPLSCELLNDLSCSQDIRRESPCYEPSSAQRHCVLIFKSGRFWIKVWVRESDQGGDINPLAFLLLQGSVSFASGRISNYRSKWPLCEIIDIRCL